MRIKLRDGIALALAAAALTGSPASAQQTGPANLAHGKTLAVPCLVCHGTEGYRNADPGYRVPKLQGQHADYLVIALQEFKAGGRPHPVMAAQAAPLSDQDMIDISAYLAGDRAKPATAHLPANVLPPITLQVCASCHGQNGISSSEAIPSLGGQYPDYLKFVITQYKHGERKSASMAAMLESIRDADIEAISNYYGAWEGVLGISK